jgi:hypothetical protein
LAVGLAVVFATQIEFEQHPLDKVGLGQPGFGCLPGSVRLDQFRLLADLVEEIRDGVHVGESANLSPSPLRFCGVIFTHVCVYATSAAHPTGLAVMPVTPTGLAEGLADSSTNAYLTAPPFV